MKEGIQLGWTATNGELESQQCYIEAMLSDGRYKIIFVGKCSDCMAFADVYSKRFKRRRLELWNKTWAIVGNGRAFARWYK